MKSCLFQSHIGAIRIAVVIVVMCFDSHFNPTLVQLESCIKCWLIKSSAVFQSHIGAIRIACEIALSDEPAASFQSHIGAIRICAVEPSIFLTCNFNPTLVQLE